MSVNVHGHRVWMKNSHVSEKVVTTKTHIIRSSYAVHVAVMGRDTVIARKIFTASHCFCVETAQSVGYMYVRHSLLKYLYNAIILLPSLELVETHPPNITMTSGKKYWQNLIWQIAHKSANPPNLIPRLIVRPYVILYPESSI